MPVLALDGGHLDRDTQQLVDTYLQRLRGVWRTEFRACRKGLPDPLPAGASVLMLDERGEVWDTPTLATWMQVHVSNLWIVIGGSHGYSRDLPVDQSLALGRLTLPHRLVAVLMAEQIYRAYTLAIGHPYHHA